MEKQVEKKSNWFRKGVLIGITAGAIYVVSNKKSRTKLVDGVEEYTEKTKHWYEVIKENREPFIDQMKTSSNKIATIVENASDDIQTLVETSQHMKEHTQALVKALQETRGEFKTLATKLKNEQRVDLDEMIPSSDEEQLLQ